MASKRKNYKPNWKIVVLGAFVFVGLGLALITAYQAGADAQKDNMQMISVDGH